MRAGLRPVVIAATSSPVRVAAPLRTQHVAPRTAVCFWTGHALTAAVTDCSSIPAITTRPQPNPAVSGPPAYQSNRASTSRTATHASGRPPQVSSREQQRA
jgi:hypothetical protein